jgi:hypothetical protein
MENNYDWSRFAERIAVARPANELYKKWTTAAGMEEFFLEQCDFIKPSGETRPKEEACERGDKYRFKWYSFNAVEEGEVLEANGTDTLKFTFAGGCIVTVTFKDEGAHTIVELTQENIPLTEKAKVNIHIGCGQGWMLYLLNTKSVYEGGIDLRNKNENIKKVLNN